ncbi:MAG TPA: YihY/virulence factor BrkB family protein [Nitrospira sp.]|nr:YihY/virulence factor BrkB family protein [Nitrospira sp.]
MGNYWSDAFGPRTLWHLIKEAAADWSHDRAPRLGAALAYYTVFSLVPFLVVVIALIGLVLGQEAAQSAILSHIATMVGDQSAAAIKDMIRRADQPSTGLVATVLAVVTLLFGASGVFGQLQDALNTVWGVEPKEGRGVWGFIKDRFLSFVAVLGTGFLLLVSLLLSSALAAFGNWFSGLLPLPEALLHLFNFALSFVVVTGLFALIFKVLPDAKVAWRDVWVGALLTATLFTIGKYALGLYLGKSNVASAYGAAGSLVLILLWVYYSAQILLYGAEFTQVYANRLGERIVPAPDAQVADPRKAAGQANEKATRSRPPGHAA